LYHLGCSRQQWMQFRPPLLPMCEPDFNNK
jgi:hypothetical protein